MRATLRSGTRKAPIPAPFCSRAWPVYALGCSCIQDVSFLSREPFPAPSNIRASEQAISNRAH